MLEFGYWLETMEDKVFTKAPNTASASEEDRIHPLRFAAEAHYRLVKIHPFEDGNGRLSRLLMNIILMRAGYPPTLIKIEDRQEYFDSLDYDSSFLSFIIKTSYETVETYMEGFGLEKASCKGPSVLPPKFANDAILLGEDEIQNVFDGEEIDEIDADTGLIERTIDDHDEF